jgi:hypothetical protein
MCVKQLPKCKKSCGWTDLNNGLTLVVRQKMGPDTFIRKLYPAPLVLIYTRFAGWKIFA